MSTEEADRVIQAYERLKPDWQRIEPEAREIARLLAPRQAEPSPGAVGDWRLQRGIYSAQGIIQKDKLVSHLWSTMINPGNKWIRATIPDEDLRDWQPVKTWLDHVTTTVLWSFSPARSTFYANAMPLFANAICFGDGIQIDEIDEGAERIRDLTLPVGQALIGTDLDGTVNELGWQFQLTAYQAARRYGMAALPVKLQEKAGDASSAEKFTFILWIGQNDRWEPGKLGSRGKPWRSLTVSVDERQIVKDAGFHDNPVSRAPWAMEPGYTYAVGQAFSAFPAVRMINLEEQATIRAAQLAAHPISLASSEKVLGRGQQVRPGTTLYGGIIAGRRNFDQLGAPSSIPITIDHQRAKVEELREAFLGTLFHLQGRTGVSSSEWFDHHAGLLRQMAPMLTNIETYYLTAKFARRFNMLLRVGAIMPPPSELDGMPLETEMQSAASLAMRAGDGAATVQLLNDLTPLMDVPGLGDRVAMRLDPDTVVEVLQAARGVPARVVRGREEADALQAQAQQQQMMMQAAELAPGMGQAVQSLAEAQAAGGDAA